MSENDIDEINCSISMTVSLVPDFLAFFECESAADIAEMLLEDAVEQAVHEITTAHAIIDDLDKIAAAIWQRVVAAKAEDEVS